MKSYPSIKIAVDITVIVADYQAGMSLREIATLYGCSFQNVQQRLLNAGVAMRPYGYPGIVKGKLQKTCPTCGKAFETYSHTQRFCCQEHIRLKAVCKHGHILTEDNRYHFPGSSSRCKQCQERRDAEYRARKAMR